LRWQIKAYHEWVVEGVWDFHARNRGNRFMVRVLGAGRPIRVKSVIDG